MVSADEPRTLPVLWTEMGSTLAHFCGSILGVLVSCAAQMCQDGFPAQTEEQSPLSVRSEQPLPDVSRCHTSALGLLGAHLHATYTGWQLSPTEVGVQASSAGTATLS